MTRRKGELTASGIDRGWPYQVALPADQVSGNKYALIDWFCRELSLCPRGHTVYRNDITYRVFCFADPAHAALFRERFSGELFNPTDRGRGGEWFLWRNRD
jgi:hypothetical protein